MFISEYLNLTDELDEKGVFDALLDKDSHFFINVIRLKNATVPEFKSAYLHLNQFFSDIATLLNLAENENDVFYRRALKKFRFSEVNGINLGFAESIYGAGFGDILSKQVLKDAYQIVKKGSTQPEIFQLVGLFEENVASDRLSDMVATIILSDIEAYTLRIYKELGISEATRPDLNFDDKGFIKNPFKNASILLLPIEILHELPIAKDWDDIDRVVTENSVIREEINAEIGDEWKKWASSDKKSYIKKHIFMEPDVCERVIDGYKKETLEPFEPSSDTEYLVELLLRKIKKYLSFKKKKGDIDSFAGAVEILQIFKDWVENNRGWDDVQNSPSAKREKVVQRLLHLAGKYYVKVNNLDFSFEPDAGRGPVDLKLSRGNDKTIIEVKLSTNGQYLHGYQEQVQEYGKAEQTGQLIYVFVDFGNPGRRKTLISEHKNNLVIVDAMEKKAASTYSADSQDLHDIDKMEWPDMKFEFDDLDWDISLKGDD